MARQRSKEREEAKDLYIENYGKISIKEIAITVGKSQSQVSKWKRLDKWDKHIPRRKRGGQKGNNNALGGGPPLRNNNAEKHGAYNTMYIDELTDEELEKLNNLVLQPKLNMIRELKLLTLKEADLESRIAKYRQTPDKTYLDKEVIVKGGEGGIKESEDGEQILTEKVRTDVRVSTFARVAILETQLDKVRGRIIKLIDSMKGWELESKKLELEERKHNLAKQRASGEYNFDPELDEITDTQTQDDMDRF